MPAEPDTVGLTDVPGPSGTAATYDVREIERSTAYASTPPSAGAIAAERPPGRSWPRRLARRCARPLAPTAVSPNQITAGRLMIGLVACGLLATGWPRAETWAGVLWVLSVFLDRVEGELARMTGKQTALGQRFDYLSDAALGTLFFVSTGIGARNTSLGAWSIALGLAAGAGVLVAQVVAETIDREQAHLGEKAFPAIGSFDFEDIIFLFAPVVWLDWHLGFLIGASVGAPAFAVFSSFRLRASRRRTGVGTEPIGNVGFLPLASVVAGLVVLVLVVRETGVAEVARHLGTLGAGGLALLLAVYVLRTAADAVSWLSTLPSLPLAPVWVCRLGTVLLAAAAFEKTTPLAGLGGEPVKALVLKRRYGIPYAESTASLVLTRTTDMIALVLFIAAGFCLMPKAGILPAAHRWTAVAALAALTATAALFFAVQRGRGLSRLRSWIGARRPRKAAMGRIAAFLDALHAVENALVTFYRARPGRFALSVLAALCELAIGAVAVYLALALLGHDGTLTEALAIEAAVLLVTAMFFFVPANVGTQEGALVLACGLHLEPRAARRRRRA